MQEIPERINGVIQEFVKGVNELLGDRVKKIVLYGSYARGDYNDSSDIDIMILTDLTDEEIIQYYIFITIKKTLVKNVFLIYNKNVNSWS